MDELVNLIAARVREELGRAPSSPGHSHTGHPGHTGDVSKPCHADKSQCVGCGLSVRRRQEDTRRIVDLGAARVATAITIADHGGVPADLARYIDHTLLKPDATRDELDKLCDEARKHSFATVCVNSTNVRHAANRLRGSTVRVCAVVGFPLGAMTSTAKAFETREAVRAGASEIDMVINIGGMKNRDYALVESDIRAVVEAAGDKAVKVILETSNLTRDEKVIACALSKAAGAAFVKTSTGFGAGGATAEDVALMKAVVGPEMEVKASGGVRTTEDAQKMIGAGATRIGASASVSIVSGSSGQKSETKSGPKRGMY
jgi:deoxyribose-phosphate aldolase